MTTFNYKEIDYLAFTDRDTYLALRAKWREDYAALSTMIREGKLNNKAIQRGDYSVRWTNIRSLKYAAERMLDIRQEQKLKAGEQRAAKIAANDHQSNIAA